MPAASFLGYLQAGIKEENKQFMQDLKKQAHLGWQIRNTIAGMMGGKPVGYMDYLEPMDLLDSDEKAYIKMAKEMRKQQNKAEAKENIQKADNILQMIRGGKKK